MAKISIGLNGDESFVPRDVYEYKEAVREFIEGEVDKVWNEIEEHDEIPKELVGKAKDAGLFGLTVPVEFGGLGLNTTGKMFIEEELGRSSYGFATLIGNHTGISVSGIVDIGTEAQKRKYLPLMATGEIIGSFALTEPGAGSDASSVRTTARRVDGGWVLNGEKIYITNAALAGIFSVVARVEGDAKGEGLGIFLVERSTPGIQVGPNERKMGMRGAHTCPLHFDECFVPDGQLLGDRVDGFRAAMKILTRGRIGLAGRSVGIATRALELAMEHTALRKQFGSRIIDNQGVGWYLAEMFSRIELARCYNRQAAGVVDRGGRGTVEAAVAKMYASEMVAFVVDKALQLHGGMGYMRDTLIERLYRDSRIIQIYEGTTEIQKNIIARELTRLAV